MLASYKLLLRESRLVNSFQSKVKLRDYLLRWGQQVSCKGPIDRKVKKAHQSMDNQESNYAARNAEIL